MEKILLNGIKVEELLEQIGKLLDDRLNSPPPQSVKFSGYLSRAEVAKLLRISLPTLHEWTKMEWLRSYKMGNRVLYKLDEVELALKCLSNRKYKKII